MKMRLFVYPAIILVVLLLVVTVSAVQGAGMSAQRAINPGLITSLNGNLSGAADAALGAQPAVIVQEPSNIYLPIVLRKIPPCFLPPVLVSPANGSTLDTITPTYEYIQVNQPISMTQLTIADNPEFNPNTQYNIYGRNPGPKQLKSFYNLKAGRLYYWHAKDICNNVPGPLTAVFTFTTGSGGAILPAPTLTSPANHAVGVGASTMVTWSAVPGATGYQLWYGPENSGNYLQFLTANSFEISSLQPNTTYLWKVNAINDYAYGDQSAEWVFTTGSFSLQVNTWMEDFINLRGPASLMPDGSVSSLSLP